MPDTPHIAIVDDEAQIREAVGEYFELHGFRVSLADGGAALRTAMADGPAVDLVILDLNMPGEDGLTIARYLREHSDMGILILTAAGETLDRIVGLEVGADDYMSKPFDLRELLARVKSVLRRTMRSGQQANTPESGDGRIEIGGFVVDAPQRKLFDGQGVEVPLTSMEYDLLQAFVSHPNTVLSRDRLLDLSHSQNSDPFDRSVDVRIARLRRKIERDPAKPQIIKTVRGVGYIYAPTGGDST